MHLLNICKLYYNHFYTHIPCVLLVYLVIINYDNDKYFPSKILGIKILKMYSLIFK